MNYQDHKKIPSYIYEKQNIIRLILLTALFALVFINIYKPFSSLAWYNVSEFKFFVFSRSKATRQSFYCTHQNLLENCKNPRLIDCFTSFAMTKWIEETGN